MNKDQIKGSVKEVAGKVQDATGRATNNAETRAKGLTREAEGKLQKSYGDVKEAVKKESDRH